MLIVMLQVVKKKYQDWEEDGDFCFCFKESSIQLDLKQQEVDSWEIVPLIASRVML